MFLGIPLLHLPTTFSFVHVWHSTRSQSTPILPIVPLSNAYWDEPSQRLWLCRQFGLIACIELAMEINLNKAKRKCLACAKINNSEALLHTRGLTYLCFDPSSKPGFSFVSFGYKAVVMLVLVRLQKFEHVIPILIVQSLRDQHSRL